MSRSVNTSILLMFTREGKKHLLLGTLGTLPDLAQYTATTGCPSVPLVMSFIVPPVNVFP